MNRALLLGLILVLAAGLLLSGCSILNGISSSQPPTQPTSQAPLLPTATDPNASLYQGAADLNQGLSALQDTLQVEDVSTLSSSTDPSLNTNAQDLNGILQSIQAEPTP